MRRDERQTLSLEQNKHGQNITTPLLHLWDEWITDLEEHVQLILGHHHSQPVARVNHKNDALQAYKKKNLNFQIFGKTEPQLLCYRNPTVADLFVNKLCKIAQTIM